VNIWIVVILLGVLAMVLGPVMMLQPSERDRQQEAVRRRATEKGLRVTLEALPKQATDLTEPERLPVYRQPAAKGGGPARDWMLVRAAYEHESHFMGMWAWQGKGRATPAERACLRQCLPRMPRSVRALSGDPGGWSVYWTEAGGDRALAVVEETLAALRDCSPSPASAPG